MPLVKLTQCTAAGVKIRDVWINSAQVVWVARNATVSFVHTMDNQSTNVLELPDVIVPAMNRSSDPHPLPPPVALVPIPTWLLQKLEGVVYLDGLFRVAAIVEIV